MVALIEPMDRSLQLANCASFLNFGVPQPIPIRTSLIALHSRAKAASQSVSLCRLRECGTIISGEFLNAFACEFVLYIERFPRSFQVKLLIRDRFTGSLVLELIVRHWEILTRPLFQNFRGHGCKLGLEDETVEQVFETADAGS